MVSCSEGIDLGTPVGLLIANIIAFLAEGELEAIRERTLASQRKLQELGRWGGGKPLYGYRAQECEDGSGVGLVHDEHASAVLLSIIDKVLDGQSTESIARELNEAGELAPSDYQRQRAGKPIRGGKWSNGHIRQQLRSKTLGPDDPQRDDRPGQGWYPRTQGSVDLSGCVRPSPGRARCAGVQGHQPLREGVPSPRGGLLRAVRSADAPPSAPQQSQGGRRTGTTNASEGRPRGTGTKSTRRTSSRPTSWRSWSNRPSWSRTATRTSRRGSMSQRKTTGSN